MHALPPHSIRQQRFAEQRLEVLRLSALGGLQVGTEFVHVVEGLGEEGPAAIDLHQGQVIQLKQKGK